MSLHVVRNTQLAQSDPPNMNIVVAFFIWLAGISPADVARWSYERRYYMHMGIALAFTTVLTGLSMTWTVYAASRSVLAIYAGVMWAGYVWNTDSALLAADSGRSGWRRIVPLCFRFLIAGVLATAISEPTICLLYSSEIQAVLARENHKAELAARQTTRRAVDGDVVRLEDEARRLENEIAEARKTAQRAQDDMTGEAKGTSGTGRPGEGPYFQLDREALTRAERELNRTRTRNESRIDENRRRIEELMLRAEMGADALTQTQRRSTGLFRQLDGLSILMYESPYIFWSRLIATLVLLSMELLPLLLRVTGPKTLYDYATEQRRREALREMNLG